MALVVKDRVRETSTTAGTGTLTLAGAVFGYQSFSVIGNANTTYYAIVDPTTGAWEVGLGTYTSSGTTLSRDTVYSNSLGTTAKIDFAANSKDVFVTYPAGKSVYLDASGNVSPLGTVASGVWQGTAVGISYGGTGQTTKTEAFDALAPTTTKGDIIVSNGTDNIRLAVGTNSQILSADSAQASGLIWADKISVTTQVSATGSSVNIAGIAATVKRVTLQFDGVSETGGNNYLVQLGDSGGISATGYQSSSSDQSGSTTRSTTGYVMRVGGAGELMSGSMVISYVAAGVWNSGHLMDRTTTNNNIFGSGIKRSLGTLTQLSISTTGGSSFDAGSFNILLE